MSSSAPASLKFNPAAIRIGIIGLGYVGLPLAVEFARKYPVVGFDVKQSRIEELKRGEDSTREVDPAALRSARACHPETPNNCHPEALNSCRSEARSAEGSCPLQFTSTAADLAACNVFIVIVPTT